MEQEIILEGIHAMLEEIRDNMKRNPELEMINSKLVAIEQVCNEFTGQKFITEEQLIRVMIYIVGQIKKLNKEQYEEMGKFESSFLKNNDYFKSSINKINESLFQIKNSLDERLVKRNIIGEIVQWIKDL